MGLIEKISKKTMKWVIKKKGLDMCKMCDDAIATESMQLCKDCYEEMWGDGVEELDWDDDLDD